MAKMTEAEASAKLKERLDFLRDEMAKEAKAPRMLDFGNWIAKKLNYSWEIFDGAEKVLGEDYCNRMLALAMIESGKYTGDGEYIEPLEF